MLKWVKRHESMWVPACLIRGLQLHLKHPLHLHLTSLYVCLESIKTAGGDN
jgi:hypothetical protein